MTTLDSMLFALREYAVLQKRIQKGENVCVTGLSPIHRAHFLSVLSRQVNRPILAICQDDMAAIRTQEELAAFLGETPPILPGRDLTFYEASGVSREWEQRRLAMFSAIQDGSVSLLIASYEALALHTMPREIFSGVSLSVRVGDTISPDEIIRQLTAIGYTRASLVEGPGQLAFRGGILDVFSPAAQNPIRIEFFGDEVDAMGWFDIMSQRRTEPAQEAVFLPIAECIPALHPGGTDGLCEELRTLVSRQRRRKTPNEALIRTLDADAETLADGLPLYAADRYLSLIYPRHATAMDYFPSDTLVVFCDYGAVSRAAAARTEQLGQELDTLLQAGTLSGDLCDFSEDFDPFCDALHGRPVLFMENFLSGTFPQTVAPKEILTVSAKQLPSYGGSMDTAVSDLQHYQKAGFRSVVLCGNRRRAELLLDTLTEKGLSDITISAEAETLPESGCILLTDGALPNGMEYPSAKLALLTEGQLRTKRVRKKKSRKNTTNRQKLSSFTDLAPGDLVVHEHHGIGRYVSMEQMKIGGVVKDYVKIAYRGSDLLYVPATQLDLISKYIGAAEDKEVRLNALSGDTWQKAKSRAKAAVKDLAEGLIQLYAERRRLPGYAFSPDSPWQQEFEDNFDYAETDDQLRCIEEIKQDMESAFPMDRLLCGDVGFGKTEVALRAAMKAILDGKQVAILVPTTVLAQQHYLTCLQRFQGFPVNVDMLSRFRSPQQQRNTLHALQAGTVDLVVGTHKLLQASVSFKDLGLLIVDEEQRFGVSHKERLKEMARGVDVLTLSATPIPRTLNMALSGLRDMSTIEEPPENRYPVQTFVMEYEPTVVQDAIHRELSRGGQVYYMHNRVETIEKCAWRLRQQMPETEIAVIHGKMHQDEISDTMQRMADGEIQILVCTTIVESGIDIPNVNTLIIEDADHLGLSQLHQLRGRVGRSNRHAFAYFTFRKGKVLSEVAEKRLTALREFAEFGSGFKIAMRDLEIRGAGNLLGAEQSGHLLSVGYDLYLKLLEDAVLEKQGKPAASSLECTADLSLNANIPKQFVDSAEQRMDLYRRMAAIRSKQDADDLLDEIVDRYGEAPRSVLNLIDVALLRTNASETGIQDIAQKGTTIVFSLRAFDFSAVSSLCSDAALKGRIFFAAGSAPALTYRLKAGEDPLRSAETVVRHLRQYTRTLEVVDGMG